MAYATHTDMVARFDERVLRDLCSDSGTPVASTDNPKMTAAIATASGRINSSLMIAGAYTPALLATLTGDDEAYLVDLTCALAMAFLIRRRGGKYGDQYKELIEQTEETLELLRTGKNIFNLDVNANANVPAIDGPTVVDYERLNMVRERMRGFYPHRARQLPIGRGN